MKLRIEIQLTIQGLRKDDMNRKQRYGNTNP
jgi:hypothetical protein